MLHNGLDIEVFDLRPTDLHYYYYYYYYFGLFICYIVAHVIVVKFLNCVLSVLLCSTDNNV